MLYISQLLETIIIYVCLELFLSAKVHRMGWVFELVPTPAVIGREVGSLSRAYTETAHKLHTESSCCEATVLTIAPPYRLATDALFE